MTTVGILGGGQLARMLALSGAPLGLRFLVMDTSADACAGQCAPMVVGDYRDQDALAEFASRIGVPADEFQRYLNAQSSPPATLMVRMKRLSERFGRMRAGRPPAAN